VSEETGLVEFKCQKELDSGVHLTGYPNVHSVSVSNLVLRQLGHGTESRVDLSQAEPSSRAALVNMLPISAPPDPPIIRCKKCKTPLSDATWKNCDRCRQKKTESYNRWRSIIKARTSTVTDPQAAASGSTSRSSLPYTSLSDLNVPSMTTSFVTSHPESFTPSHPAGTYIAPPDLPPNGRDHNLDPTGSSQPSSSIPRTGPAPAAPSRPVEIPEYQWCDELIDDFIAQPPRSNFIGKFSIIPDPQVDNLLQAYTFVNQLRAKGLSISCAAHPLFE
jgi:hypothetical protein